jgi:hypothetical protein
MFSRQPKENREVETNEEQKINIEPPVNSSISPSSIESINDGGRSELVNSVEKISKIISPYFIVIVGLILSERNFLIGGILIFLGIISLLKISKEDVLKFIQWLKNSLGLN